MAPASRKNQQSIAQLKEDLAWGEYAKVWRMASHPLHPDLVDAYANFLREDFEQEAEFTTVVMALCGVYEYYTDAYVIVQNALHVIEEKKADDPMHVLGRLACNGRLIDPKMPNVQPAPKGSWQRADVFGLITCEKCQPTILHPHAELFLPHARYGYFAELEGSYRAAWQEFFYQAINKHLKIPADDFTMPSYQVLLGDFVRACHENHPKMQGPYPAQSPFHSPYSLHTSISSYDWLELAYGIAQDKEYKNISYIEGNVLNPHFIRRVHTLMSLEAHENL